MAEQGQAGMPGTGSPAADDVERARLTAYLEVAQHQADRTGDLAALERLHDEVAGRFGPVDPLALLIRCGLEEERSKHRAPAESAAVWHRLRVEAEPCLPAEHTTLMSIRSYEAQYVRRRGADGDLDRGVRMYEDELRLRRQALGMDNHRTRITRANLAVALRERGRAEDLAESRRLLRDEVEYRRIRYGEEHEFTAQARANLAKTLIRLCETGVDGRAEPAIEALAIATRLVHLRRERFGRADGDTLAAHALRAHALLVSGRRAEAANELEYVRASGGVIDQQLRQRVDEAMATVPRPRDATPPAGRPDPPGPNQPSVPTQPPVPTQLSVPTQPPARP